ncbi:Hypothetical predicted protein [Mytilus galloprovincialis]|uniref:C1q domain-containing protein n=1 Tax=Mytilus galloprovincialis TaxID=29158 RepID=A0A8B6FH21_MYTGA|nr:Hypothetical predicted protein [Mytilus galloprovincialis]
MRNPIIVIIVMNLVREFTAIPLNSSCQEKSCTNPVLMPLTDNVNAPLVAKLDMSEINRQLKTFIESAIEIRMEERRERIRDELSNNTTELLQLLVEEKAARLNESRSLSELKSELQSLRMQQTNVVSSLEQRNRDQLLLSSRVNTVFDRTATNESKVGFTVCVHANAAKIDGGSQILFDSVRSNYGVDVSSLNTSGNFTCTKTGLYLTSATIRSKTNSAYFAIYQNDYAIVYGYTAEHDKTDTFQHSGTIQCVISLSQGDVISVKPWKTIEVNAWSCLTVVMVK